MGKKQYENALGQATSVPSTWTQIKEYKERIQGRNTWIQWKLVLANTLGETGHDVC